MAVTLEFALVLLLVAAVCSKSLGQELTQDQRRQIAHRIIVESARVQPHELVVIRGNAAFMPLMEDLAVEASKVGGYAVLTPSTDSFFRSVLTEVPDEYLGQRDPTLAWIKSIDLFIDLPFLYNEAEVTRDIPQSKFTKLMGTSADDFRAAVRDSKSRSLYIEAPVPAEPALTVLTCRPSAPCSGKRSAQMSQASSKLASALPTLSRWPGRSMSPPLMEAISHSDWARQAPMISGGVTHREASNWDDRNATLPAGDVAAAVAPGTFEGRISTPEDYCQGLVKLTGVSYQFSAGKMTAFKAQENEKCLQDLFAANSGSKDVVASVQIGLNPALKSRSKTSPFNAAGMFWVFLGRDDRFGATGTQLYWEIPVANATVNVDGRNIIENGQLHLQ